MAIGYIQMIQYKAYFEMFHPIDDLDFVIDVLQDMDSIYVDRAVRLQKRKSKS
jgi:hypothetical protein